jgi:membrane associated rhomboid family serine protease
VTVIIGLNVVVFLAWQAAGAVTLLMDLMVTNFLVSTTHLMHGLVWTPVTAAFSHSEIWHLAINMFVLWSFGTVLERLWGLRRFVLFYLVAAVVASLCHCAVSTMLMGNSDIPALGASGAVSGLLLAYALLFPRHKILLMGIIPVPALAGVLAFVGIDLWGLFAQTRGGGLPIGHGAHLGGALAGALMWYFFMRDTRPEPQTRPFVPPGRTPVLSAEEVHEFERIRVKIETQGPQALNPKEQDFLDRLRERVMRAGGHGGG